MRNISVLTMVLILTVAATLKAQPVPENTFKPGVIRGVVIDSSTRGVIEYATVGLYKKADSSLVTGVVSAFDGTFLFRDIKFGDYYVEFGFLGYTKKQIPVTLSVSQPGFDLGNIALNPDVTKIGEVQVTAQSQRIEYKIDKKVVNIAQDLTSAGGTLASALENTPSVEVDVEGNVSLRGSSNFQLLIDGKPSVIQGSEGLQQIPASAVQNIEIITSPSAKYDPDGNAGIINVIMKKQKNKGFNGIINLSAGTGNKYSGDFLLNFKHEKINFFVGGELADMNFLNKGRNEKRNFTSLDTTYILSSSEGLFSRKSASLKSGFDLTLSDNSSLSLSAVIGNRGFDRNFNSRAHWYTFPATIDSFYRDESNGNESSNYYNVNLDFQKKYSDEHTLQASVYYAASKENETEEEIVRETDPLFRLSGSEPAHSRSRIDQPEMEMRFELDYTRPVGSGKIETGLQSRYDKDKSDYIYERYMPLGSEWVRNDSISNTMDFLDLLESAYLIYSGKAGKFEYQGGVRTEYDHRSLDQNASHESFTYEKFHFFPSFYITRKLSDAHQLQLTYSRRIQRPNERDLNPFKEFWSSNNVVYGNPALRPEFTNAFELNYQYTHDKGFLSLETYYRETYDKITRISGTDSILGRLVNTTTSINANRDYSLGIELMANTELTKWWQINLTGNFFRYRLKGEVEGSSVSSVSNSWRTSFNSSFKLKWDTRLQFSGFYNGPANTLQGKREGFFVANVAIRKEMMKKKLSISLNARDIFATGKFSSTSAGSKFYIFNEGRREAPVIMLNLTYRINNFRQAARRDNEERSESGSGMDEMM